MTNIQKIIEEFDGNFMNNGVDGILKDEFQEPKMLIIKSFFLSSLHQIRQETLEEVEEEIEKKKRTKEAILEEEKEIIARDNWFYNQAISDIINLIQAKK